jgi:hypothetical protein
VDRESKGRFRKSLVNRGVRFQSASTELVMMHHARQYLPPAQLKQRRTRYFIIVASLDALAPNGVD